MKLNNKGFTLLELFSVLAIIVVIIFMLLSIISSEIDHTKLESAKDKTKNLLNITRLAFTQDEADNYKYELGSEIILPDGKVGDYKIEASGEMPIEGKIRINKDGSVEAVGLKYKDIYCATQSTTSGEPELNSGKVECSKNSDKILNTFDSK